MRILYFGNNWVGWKIVSWLREQNEEIVGLVLHSPKRRKYGEEIINSAGLSVARIFDGSQLHQPDVVEAISELKPQIGISVLFGYILKRDVLDLMPAGCLNVHPALLPYNRGANPNVWSIIERTPAGVTVHYIDEGVDTGAIVAQSQVQIEPVDTGKSLYRKLEYTAVELFKETWPLIHSRRPPVIPQNKNKGTYHRLVDVNDIDQIDLNCTYKAGELIDIIRARSFPPYPGAYFWQDGRKVYLRLRLLYEEQLREDDTDEPDRD